MFPAPKGYRFAVAAAGFRKEGRMDLGLVVSDAPAAAAGVFTLNRFQAAPVLVAREALGRSDSARAVLINAGQANACTGDEGLKNCRDTLRLIGVLGGLPVEEILPASTGVIGEQLRMEKWEKAAPALIRSLGKAGPADFAQAIMTTDAFPKMAWRQVELPGGEARVLGMAKGGGMIGPNMATMLGVILTDARVNHEDWKTILKAAVDKSFNRITVDGDTSTNDCVFALANGASGASAEGPGLEALASAVSEVCRELAYLIVQDAEGGTKVLRIRVTGAESDADALLAARTVGGSPLVKTAFYGEDGNWGRIVAALGRSGAAFDTAAVSVDVAGIRIFHEGKPVTPSQDPLLAAKLKRDEITVDISLGDGKGACEFLASDLTHAYIDCNASYRS